MLAEFIFSKRSCALNFNFRTQKYGCLIINDNCLAHLFSTNYKGHLNYNNMGERDKKKQGERERERERGSGRSPRSMSLSRTSVQWLHHTLPLTPSEGLPIHQVQAGTTWSLPMVTMPWPVQPHMLPQLPVSMPTNPSKHKQRGNTSADEQKGAQSSNRKNNGQIDHWKVVLNFHECRLCDWRQRK
jgi:hypothetical protein